MKQREKKEAGKKKKKKKKAKNRESSSCGTISSDLTTGVLEREEKEKGAEEIFEEIMNG